MDTAIAVIPAKKNEAICQEQRHKPKRSVTEGEDGKEDEAHHVKAKPFSVSSVTKP